VTRARTVPATSARARVVRATSARARVVPATSARERVVPATSARARVVPATSARARAVPATSARALVALVALLCPAALAAQASAADAPLRGRTIVLNPGHNGANATAPGRINRLVGIGQGATKACDTTGTATDGGYSEAAFNWDVAVRARRVLRRRGATVVLTRSDNHSVGPCIDERARIANRARADATVSIHADGASPSSFGFHVIEPALIRGLTDDVFGASHRLALAVRAAFRAATGEPYATYIGRDGVDRRDDLGGLRLADVPSIFVEAGNMRNAGDARRMRSGAYRLRAARGIANGIQRYLAR
jgi:N-acetylmuramoyl-L-alanine amidase